MTVQVVVERGPKAKKAVAFAVDWPGWSRGATTPELALATLGSYRQRYRPVAVAAGMTAEFDRGKSLDVIEEKTGTGSTDFWGVSFSPSATEQGPMSAEDLERKVALLESCWAFFDTVAAGVSADMRKGPRGGGRDRDRIVLHTMWNESRQFAKRLGLREPEDTVMTPEGLQRHRTEYVKTIRAYNAGQGRRMKTWTLAFLIRHTAYHVMDHAWEMQDKDLSGSARAAVGTRGVTAKQQGGGRHEAQA
jgi:hypothetical protein